MQDMKKLDKFLTVDEARSLAAVARGLLGAYKREQTKVILLSVKEAAEKGQTSVTIYSKDCTDQVIIDRLTGLVYALSVFSDQRDGDSLTINWD